MPSDAEATAAHAGLRHVTDATPGIRRRRAGKGFDYRTADGAPVRDAATLDRIKALAMEFVHKPIRIIAFAPGGMATPLGTTIRMPEDVDYELIKRFSGLRGLVEVEQVADLIAYLCSDAAQGFHGACVNIDRGITAG